MLHAKLSRSVYLTEWLTETALPAQLLARNELQAPGSECMRPRFECVQLRSTIASRPRQRSQLHAALQGMVEHLAAFRHRQRRAQVKEDKRMLVLRRTNPRVPAHTGIAASWLMSYAPWIAVWSQQLRLLRQQQ